MTRGRLALAALVVCAACARVRAPAPASPLRVGLPVDYPPFAAARDGEFAGLDVDVARRFAADVGRGIAFVPFHWPDLTSDLAAGRFDVAMGGITMRPERAVVGRFTRPVLETGAVVLAPASIVDVNRRGVRLAVNAGGHLERVARRLFPRASLRTTRDNTALAGLVAGGDADAVLTDDVEADVLAPSLPGLRRRGPLTRDRKAYLARDPALADQLDRWLRDREADGTLDTLRARWLGDGRRLGRSGFDSDVAALVALVDLRLAFMPMVAAAKEARGLPIDDPGQESRVVARSRSQAITARLDPETAEGLMRAAIAAAKVVQRRWLATPPGRRPPVETLDLERELRPALDGLSTAMLARAADLVREPGALAAVAPARLADAFDVDLPADARLALAHAVVALRAAGTPVANRGL